MGQGDKRLWAKKLRKGTKGGLLGTEGAIQGRSRPTGGNHLEFSRYLIDGWRGLGRRVALERARRETSRAKVFCQTTGDSTPDAQ